MAKIFRRTRLKLETRDGSWAVALRSEIWDGLLGSVGDSFDSALAETANGLYKTEAIHRRGPWRSFEAVEYATLKWVDWYNNRSLLAPIGNIPPAGAEAARCAARQRATWPRG